MQQWSPAQLKAETTGQHDAVTQTLDTYSRKDGQRPRSDPACEELRTLECGYRSVPVKCYVQKASQAKVTEEHWKRVSHGFFFRNLSLHTLWGKKFAQFG